MSSSRGFVRRLPDRLDGYTLRALFGPLLLTLIVLLVAQILAKLLKLFDLAAATGASPLLVAKISAMLVPHQLGIALPAAFFAAVFMSVARIGDDNELDAMLATGRSIARMAVPYFVVAIGLVGFNFYLYGYLQPMTRYGYRADYHAAQQTGWNARLEDNSFVTVKNGYTLGADEVGPDGRQLRSVFVQHRDAGQEEIITATQGQLSPSADGKRLLLGMSHGMIVSNRPDGSVRTVQFGDAHLNEDFTAVPPPYRDRGNEVRELTLPELRQAPAGAGAGEITDDQRAGQFHWRLASIFLPLLLPLLALPLGMAAKRGRRTPGTVFAAVALLVLYEALQLGESLGEKGSVPAWLAVWVPFATFGGFGIWLFRSSLQWPGDNPVMRAVSAIEAGFSGLHLVPKAHKS